MRVSLAPVRVSCVRGRAHAVAPDGCDQFARSLRVRDNQSSLGLMAGLNRRLTHHGSTCHQTQSGYTRACPMVGCRTSVRVLFLHTLGSTRVMLGARTQCACECPPASPRATTHSHPRWHSASAIRMPPLSGLLPHTKRAHSPRPWAYSGASPGRIRVSAPPGPSPSRRCYPAQAIPAFRQDATLWR